tara:strand:- start:9 stop:548 length:540 start_codon:yes stop_codon:yes gene_type:complete
MATLATTNVKHASSSSNNIVLHTDGTTHIPGHIVQVVQATTDTEVSTNSTTPSDTGLTVSITPTSSNSKILVLVSQAYRARHTAGPSVGGDIRLVRGSNVLVFGPGDYGIWHQNGTGNVDIFDRVNYQYLDSPSYTLGDSITYKTTAVSYNSAHYIWTQPAANATSKGNSYITVMEVAA